MPSLYVNGEEHTLSTGATVSSLVAALNLDIRKIAIECNLEIVPRSAYDTTVLKEGDRVEIVQFMGGG